MLPLTPPACAECGYSYNQARTPPDGMYGVLVRAAKPSAHLQPGLHRRPRRPPNKRARQQWRVAPHAALPSKVGTRTSTDGPGSCPQPSRRLQCTPMAQPVGVGGRDPPRRTLSLLEPSIFHILSIAQPFVYIGCQLLLTAKDKHILDSICDSRGRYMYSGSVRFASLSLESTP